MKALRKIFSRKPASPPEETVLPRRPFRFGVVIGTPMARQELLDTAQMVEELGYSCFSISDHLHQDFAQLAPLVALASVAEHTRRIELSSMVLANDFRHPAVLAQEAATLSVLSQGRFSLGLGAGWYAPDYQVSGIEFRPPAERVARVAETIEVLRGLWTGEPFSFDGEHYRLREMQGKPLPAPRGIPLLVGGSGPVMLSLAARKAHVVGLNPGLPLTAGKWQQGPTPYRDATDRKLAWIVRAAPHRLAELELQAQVLAGGITAGDTQTLLAPMAGMMGVSVAQLAGCPHFLAGSEEQCLASLRTWRERWGINYFTFPHSLAQQMAPVVAALCQETN